jgi:hypothetical protein
MGPEPSQPTGPNGQRPAELYRKDCPGVCVTLLVLTAPSTELEKLVAEIEAREGSCRRAGDAKNGVWQRRWLIQLPTRAAGPTR